MKIPKLLLIVFCMGVWALFSTPSFAGNIYITQAATGASTGTDCANALPASWFNNGANWGSGSNQIGPGTVVHLCGTFNGSAGQTMLTTQGSGSSGNPITILFEDNAVLSSPSWGANGAIFVNRHSFITIDGGTNGIIQNTASGTLLANTTTTSGIEAPTSDNLIIKNLTISNIYVHPEGVNDASCSGSRCGDNSNGIHWCGSNVLFNNNIITNVGTGIGDGSNSVGGCTNVAGVEDSFNTFSLCNHCITIGIGSGTITGIKVHDNDISDTYNWDQLDNGYHHNYIFTFASPAGVITGDYYNNNLHGISSRDSAYGGSHTTALIFLEDDNSNSRVFNNLFTLDSGDLYGTANGLLTGSPLYVFNNTFAPARNTGNSCLRAGAIRPITVKNNIFTNCGGIAIYLPGTPPPAHTIDNNIYYLPTPKWWYGTDAFINFATWKTDCSCDSLSVNGSNPNLTSSYKLSSGSIAVGAGANLSGLGITALLSDKVGILRPSVTAWDLGAYQFSGITSSAPNPPTGLSVVVQ